MADSQVCAWKNKFCSINMCRRSCMSMCFISHPKLFGKFRLYLVVLEIGNLRFDLLRQYRFDPHQSREILTSTEAEIHLSWYRLIDQEASHTNCTALQTLKIYSKKKTQKQNVQLKLNSSGSVHIPISRWRKLRNLLFECYLMTQLLFIILWGSIQFNDFKVIMYNTQGT